MFRRIAIALSVLLSAVFFAPAAVAAPQDDILAMVNDVRAQNGLATLAAMDGLTSVAQSWSQQMANAGSMSHNPNAGSQIPAGWQSWAENVGYASGHSDNARVVFDAWMNSEGHKANILNPNFTHIGVGVVVDGNGTLWATQNFGQYPGGTGGSGGGAAAPPASTPEPEPAPAPEVVPEPVVEPAPEPEPAPVEQTEPTTPPVVVEAPVVTPEPTPEQTTMAVPEPTSTTVDKGADDVRVKTNVDDDGNDRNVLHNWWFWLLVVIAIASTIGAIAVYQNDKKRRADHVQRT